MDEDSFVFLLITPVLAIFASIVVTTMSLEKKMAWPIYLCSTALFLLAVLIIFQLTQSYPTTVYDPGLERVGVYTEVETGDALGGGGRLFLFLEFIVCIIFAIGLLMAGIHRSERNSMRRRAMQYR